MGKQDYFIISFLFTLMDILLLGKFDFFSFLLSVLVSAHLQCLGTTSPQEKEEGIIHALISQLAISHRFKNSNTDAFFKIIYY